MYRKNPEDSTILWLLGAVAVGIGFVVISQGSSSGGSGSGGQVPVPVPGPTPDQPPTPTPNPNAVDYSDGIPAVSSAEAAAMWKILPDYILSKGSVSTNIASGQLTPQTGGGADLKLRTVFLAGNRVFILPFNAEQSWPASVPVVFAAPTVAENTVIAAIKPLNLKELPKPSGIIV